ncbi:signal recognition particle subunit SRP68-like [Saccoglossus kowalevskii]|uniref:Signal recognition particle subunit SRP68 n=1 Tax=Saccoglossus kowalevskii TaxID=10224 RepID=A0ABM0MMB4_SACKO|nr:PREDICTED: signal recognition particle subunit SRP68-like [Saccoglossus kowalevskii]
MAEEVQNVAEVVPEEPTPEATTPTDTYTIEVLQIIKEAQQQHGLRHGDQQRYRGYCTRKLRRIRKSVHFVLGHRNRFNNKKITEDIMKDFKTTHMSLSEIGAYSAWMKATLHFELSEWQSAIELFSKAKTIYEKLGGALDDEQQILYKQRVEEIAPNIRYCAYNIGDETAIDDLVQMRLKSGPAGELSSNLDMLIQQTREKQSATLSEVTWRGRTVGVKQEQIRVFLLNVQQSEDEINKATDSETKISVYDTLLLECRDVIQELRDEIKADPKQKTQKADGRISNLEYLHSYVTYIKISKTIDRNKLMVETMKDNLPGGEVQEGKKMTKPQDMIRLYDIIIQNLTDISQLPGLEDDDKLKEEIDYEILVNKAFRCFYVAQSYSFVKKRVEASALYERVLHYTGIARKQSKTASGQNNKDLLTKIEELTRIVKGLKYSIHASAILDTQDMTEGVSQLSVQNNKPLIDRLEEYRDDPSLLTRKPNLVTFPPNFQPIPCKPLFFDIAFNHVEFPSLEDKVEQKKAAGGGLTGFVKGWLWGGKK